MSRLPTLTFWSKAGTGLMVTALLVMLVPFPAPAAGYYNMSAFWKAPLTWSWMGGQTASVLLPFYGTLGVASTANLPGGHDDMWGGDTAYATDAAGNYWMYGGVGVAQECGGAECHPTELWKFSSASSAWSWAAGSSLEYEPPVWGTQGTANAGNLPGANSGGFGWVDASTNFWLYGGYFTDANWNWADGSAVWKYSPTTSAWTWVSGVTDPNALPAYGTRGSASTANTPGGRSDGGSWVDPSGNFWLFGSEYSNNDLWKFAPGTKKWTWVSGSTTQNGAAVYGTQGTGSTGNIPGGRALFSTWVDGSSNLWLYGGNGVDAYGSWGYLGDLWKFATSNNKWTFISGAQGVWTGPIFGSQGVGSTGNMPGSRIQTAGWMDASGNFWLFGGTNGSNYNSILAFPGVMNDLWKFTPANSQWTWVSGASTDLGTPVYGTPGVGSTANTPGARSRPQYWKDGSGNLWVFGGLGVNASGRLQPLQDIWKFTPSNSQWTFVGGNTLLADYPVYGTQGVPGTNVTPGIRADYTDTPTSAAWRDATGNLWLFGGRTLAAGGFFNLSNDLWRYSPSNSQWTYISGTSGENYQYGTQGSGSTANNPTARCSMARWMDGSGKFWLFGGGGPDAVGNWGPMNDLWTFNPANSQWTWIAGSSTLVTTATYGTPGVANGTNFPGPRQDPATWKDGAGNFWMFGGNGWDGNGGWDYLDDLWTYSPSSSQWTWVAGGTTALTPIVPGTKGVGSTSNHPGARAGMQTWVDGSGKFWLFGGDGWDTLGAHAPLNDLWKFDPTNSQWTWVSGASDVCSSCAVYGTQGVGSTANTPGGRYGAAFWTDPQGNFMLYGGSAYDALTNWDQVNDLWKFNPSNSQWTWVSGASSAFVPGVYGTQGQPAFANHPGGEFSAPFWSDGQGGIWIYSGMHWNNSGFDLFDSEMWRLK